jgi:hypothetical protein
MPTDTANLPISLQAPYGVLPEAPPGAPIEPGRRVKLDARQQEAVVAGVIKWMKDPASVSFGDLAGARNSRGVITVCGNVNGRNSARTYVGMSPFIGALMGGPTTPQFVLVEIGSSGKQRAEVEALCQQSGVAPPPA